MWPAGGLHMVRRLSGGGAATDRDDAAGGASPAAPRADGPASRAAQRAVAALTRADRLVFYTLVGLGVALLFLPRGAGEPAALVVEGTGGYRSVAPLSEDGRIEVPGPLGTTVVEVRDGAARVVSSPCPQKTCIAMGAVAEPGDIAVCVPNGVIVRIEGDATQRLDATTR